MEQNNHKCSYCGIIFNRYTKPSRIKKFKHLFCCIKHRSKFVNENGAYWLDQNRRNGKCSNCEKNFYKKRCNVKFCSSKCNAQFRLKNNDLLVVKKGEQNPSWKGGKSTERAKIRSSKKFLDWRKSVFERDDYTCQTCKIRGKNLEAHHIKQFAFFPELRFELDNGLTLCRECHKLTDNYKNHKKEYAIN